MELEVLKDARILAGGDGLGRRLTSVTVGEVPDIADWLSGGEMVLSTMFAVKGDVERQREFCRRVMMSGAAALFVKTTRFVENMPADIIDLANKRKFPIIEVPQGLRWTRLMQDATEVIINSQASQLERSQAIHKSLLGVVIRGGGWQELADEASRLLDSPVMFLDVSLEVLSASGSIPAPSDIEKSLHTSRVREQFSALGRSGKLFHVQEEGVPAMFVLPVVSGHQGQGYICAISEAQELSQMEMMVLEHSATIASLEIAQDRVRFETEVRLKGDFVDEVISGGAATTDSLLRRGAFLGCDLSQGATVILLGVDEFEGLVSRKALDQEQLERRMEKYFSRCSRYVSASEPSSLVSLKSGHVIVFLCGKTAQDAVAVGRIAQVLQGFGRSEADLSISVGIASHVPEPSEMGRGYQEALVALKVGRKLGGPGSLVHFGDVGTYRLLLDIWERDPDQVRSLYEETIAPIDHYDATNGTQLTKTLSTFLTNDESLIKTASDLYAHRHTIRYRLEKIAELTGLSVFKTEHKERLGLGLKARSLFLS
ncbi:MAG: PucR family transcriptional regulator ligand-binding domain-containing protein [Actinobacteria bacterium]|nr:PucR family transcriptional regulator ligand-binding domain-containing protein [Actinomycetota bacterium]